VGKGKTLDKPFVITIESATTLNRFQIVEQMEMIQETEDRKAPIAFGTEVAGKSSFCRARYFYKDHFVRCKESTKRPEGLGSAPVGYYEERFSGKEVFDKCNFIQDGDILK
jgi:hypothetical protein